MGSTVGRGSDDFWPGVEWFLDPQGGNKLDLSEEGKGGGIKDKTLKFS